LSDVKREYDRFYDALLAAQSWSRRLGKSELLLKLLPSRKSPARDATRCALADEARGLKDPRPGRIPYAAVQLRQENLRPIPTICRIQNHLKFGEQRACSA